MINYRPGRVNQNADALSRQPFESNAVEDGPFGIIANLRVRPDVPQKGGDSQLADEHGGMYGTHLREAKLYGQHSKHYWWPKMSSDIENWCRGCVTCATRQPGRAVKLVLTPFPVSGSFDRVGVDVIHFSKSSSGNSYAVVFVDYVTKWPEVFPTADQSTLTIAKLLVEEIIPRHGVPKELLSDRGPAFLSKVICDVYRLLGVHKLNTSAYHPRTDGLVERFNRTLTNMLAKTVEQGGKDWDIRLPFVLFAYRSSLQSSTRESPLFLLYGRDPQLPTGVLTYPPAAHRVVDVDDYKSRLSVYIADA